MRSRLCCSAGLATAALVLAACGGSAHQGHAIAATVASRSGTAASSSSASLDGPTLSRPALAPPLRLPNYRGREVALRAYRGKAVLLTFVYTHCHDVCPTIVARLHEALVMLGSRAREVQVIGVTVDPKGDTPAAISSFLAEHEMTGRMQYLTGSRGQLTPVWRQWNISAANPTAHDAVDHTALVYGISASGRVMTVYPANFTPANIAHDVPILAKL
jgi:protein SCO1/2